VPIEWHIADAYQVEDGQIVGAIFGFPDVATALDELRTWPHDSATLSEVLKPDRHMGS
jgi:hypothetical protein